MTNRDHKLSLARQAELLGISRGSLYDKPRPTRKDDLKLMRRIDALHMEEPFAGSPMMKGLLRQEGFGAGRWPWKPIGQFWLTAWRWRLQLRPQADLTRSQVTRSPLSEAI